MSNRWPAEVAVRAISPGQEVGVPGQGAATIDVHLPGGELLQQLLHPSVTVFDQIFRIQPEEGWFNPAVSPNNPVQFEIGNFRVPRGVHLWMQNYEFAIYRQSGADAGDSIRCEDDRFNGSVGFDLTVNGTRPASILVQLDPVPATTARNGFGAVSGSGESTVVTPGVIQSSNVGNTSSQGQSLMPPRSTRMGAPAPNPFTVVVKENQNISLTCVLLRPIRSPLAFVQGELQGYLMQTNASEALLNRMRPR